MFLILVVTFPVASYGYIDPGSGHLLWQAIMAGFFGGVYFVRRLFPSLTLFKRKAIPINPPKQQR